MTIYFNELSREENESALLFLLEQFQMEQKKIAPEHPKTFSCAAFNEQKEQIGGIIATQWMNTCHINLLAVSSPYRNQKIGLQLLEKAESFAQSQDARYLTVHTQDYQAKSFYEQFGYTVFGRIPDMPFTGTTKYYLVKDLL